MKNLYQTFRKSIYNPAFYQQVAGAPLGDAVRFYLKSILVFTIVLTLGLGIFLSVLGTTFIRNHAPSLVKNYYPADLSVHIEKGEASANVSMPYFVPMRSLDGATSTVGSVKNLLVIDTTHEFDKKAFDGYRTYALLTKTDLVTSNDDGQITMQSLHGAPAVTISQEVLLSWIDQIHRYLVPIILIGAVVMFILFIFGYLVYLAILLLFAFIPMVIAWLKKTPLTYLEAYKISLYAIVPALALKTVLNLLGLFFLPSYLTLLVFMLVVAINLRNEEEPKLFKN